MCRLHEGASINQQNGAMPCGYCTLLVTAVVIVAAISAELPDNNEAIFI
ncbi:MAG: hypothetical protein JSS37_09370 [Proteobacteria bacterium]|nr:hypothetical protein [Pseudomonadota bacterium]